MASITTNNSINGNMTAVGLEKLRNEAKGLVAEQKYTAAFELFKKIANLTLPSNANAALIKQKYKAITDLTYFYSNGVGGVEKNVEKVISLLTESSQHGHAKAQVLLATIYETNKPAEAFKLYKQAADQGEPNAIAKYVQIAEKIHKEMGSQDKATVANRVKHLGKTLSYLTQCMDRLYTQDLNEILTEFRIDPVLQSCEKVEKLFSTLKGTLSQIKPQISDAEAAKFSQSIENGHSTTEKILTVLKNLTSDQKTNK